MNSVPIYALCDVQTLDNKKLTIEDFVKICHSHSVHYIQYRDKTQSTSLQIDALKKLKSLTKIPIIINDNYALLPYCDGLHLGQQDMQVFQKKLACNDQETLIKTLRKKHPNKILGVSTHTVDEVNQANNCDLDYIGLGAYRKTNTKDVSYILGKKLEHIASFSKHPVAAIGGVKKEDTIKNVNYLVIGSGLYED